MNDLRSVPRSVTVGRIEIPFEVSAEDHVDFDDQQLQSLNSWTVAMDDAPRNVPLPPGRLEHELNARRVRRFVRSAGKHREKFESIIGRMAEAEEDEV